MMQIIENVKLSAVANKTGTIVLVDHLGNGQLSELVKFYLEDTPFNFPTEGEVQYIRKHSNKEEICMDNVGVRIENENTALLKRWCNLMKRK